MFRHFVVLVFLSAALGAVACGDLVVDNPNAPDASKALADPAVAEEVISSGWVGWWRPTYNFYGGGVALSTMAFQHSTSATCQSGVQFSAIPRQPIPNTRDWAYYPYLEMGYDQWYRNIAQVNAGLRALLIDRVADLGPDQDRAVAWGRFVQGLSYGYLALLYEAGPVVDETTDLQGPAPQHVGYRELMDASLGFLDEAIALARSSTFVIPSDWHFMVPAGEVLTSTELASIMSSYKARLRAAVARTPAERQAVDWGAVLTEIQDGLSQDLAFRMTRSGWSANYTLYYMLYPGWGQMSYFVAGMADQSGKYQEWMSLSVDDRRPDLATGPFLIRTPDLRFPQGTRVAEQQANPGTRYMVAETPAHQWIRPDRGTWRWSYYRDRQDPLAAIDGELPEMSMGELDLLAAEAHYRLGDRARAAELVNRYRTVAGLDATDASGSNTSCVPRLPDGSCGDLFEMLKWEKRMNTGMSHALLAGAWFFDSRGWGDLHQGTMLQRPVPDRVAELAGLPVASYGGSMEWGAPVGNYGY